QVRPQPVRPRPAVRPRERPARAARSRAGIAPRASVAGRGRAGALGSRPPARRGGCEPAPPPARCARACDRSPDGLGLRAAGRLARPLRPRAGLLASLRAGEAPSVKRLDDVWIPMRDGVRLSARMWLPDETEARPVPAILEYIPYRKDDATAPRDASLHG